MNPPPPTDVAVADPTPNPRFALFIPGDPVPQGSMRAIQSKHQRFPSVVPANQKHLAEWRAQCAANIRLNLPPDRFDRAGMFALHIDFYLRRPSAHYLPVNQTRTHPELRLDAPTWVTKTPDIDKLVRAVLDASTDAGVWNDDAQVVYVVATKRYANDPRAVGVTVTYSAA